MQASRFPPAVPAVRLIDPPPQRPPRRLTRSQGAGKRGTRGRKKGWCGGVDEKDRRATLGGSVASRAGGIRRDGARAPASTKPRPSAPPGAHPPQLQRCPVLRQLRQFRSSRMEGCLATALALTGNAAAGSGHVSAPARSRPCWGARTPGPGCSLAPHDLELSLSTPKTVIESRRHGPKQLPLGARRGAGRGAPFLGVRRARRAPRAAPRRPWRAPPRPAWPPRRPLVTCSLPAVGLWVCRAASRFR